MSTNRHLMCHIQKQAGNALAKNRWKPHEPVKKTTSIIVQVKKVSADVSELQKTLAVEAAARNELQISVDKLKAEAEQTKLLLAREREEGERSNDITSIMMDMLPCKSLVELDELQAFVEDKNGLWIKYIKFLGGRDVNSAIQKAIDTLMDRSVQKQLSWSGINTKKPSFKSHYKKIIDGIHVAMRDNFRDYSVVRGEEKIYSILKNAAKRKN